MDALIGTTVEDRYRIEALLGAGAMGRVYRARHVRVGREVAIKVMRADLVSEPRIVARFEREAEVAARMRHPNLVGVVDVGATPSGERFMVMELAPGVSLAELVDAPMPRERAVALLGQLLRGLSFAHGAGLIHRDLKPENVLIDLESWHARIVDFGIAVLRDREARADRRLTEAGLVVGTPMYMAPEQATGKDVDARADLFSLGVIAYELLAGTTPFEGTGAEVALANVSKDPPYIADRVPGLVVDALLETFARKLMARRPEARFASAHDALVVLETIDRDRDAAAVMLGLRREPLLEAPPAMLRLPRGSDALSTQPMAPPEHVVDDSTEHVVRAPRRRWPIVAAAVAVLALAAGWAMTRGDATPPASAAITPAAPAMAERPEPPHTQVGGAPALGAAVVPQQPHALATAKLVVQVAARTEVAEPTPATHIAAPETDRPTHDASADALAARYRAVGHALVEHGTDELWQRYRLIQLGTAMATADTREQALTVLDAIEHALPARS